VRLSQVRKSGIFFTVPEVMIVSLHMAESHDVEITARTSIREGNVASFYST
jgi:hypothetical protein